MSEQTYDNGSTTNDHNQNGDFTNDDFKVESNIKYENDQNGDFTNDDFKVESNVKYENDQNGNDTNNHYNQNDEYNQNTEYNQNSEFNQNNEYSQDNENTENNESNNVEETEEPEQFRKLFIGSLNYSTTEDGMREYFGQFGQILDCVIMKEPKTNKSRGFGFVSYAKSANVDDVMKARPHKLDGRELETKRATPREESGKPGAEITTKKLFVGAIKEGLTEDHLKEYFTPYGTITDCIIMREKETQKPRGFGFVSFDDYDPVDKIVLEKYHTINGQSVAVKKALPKNDNNNGGGFRGGRGGGGRGNYNNYGRNDNYNNNNNDFSGGNFEMMAQKMFQAAAMGNYGGNKRMGGPPQRQMNFANDDFEGFDNFGNKSGGPMKGNKNFGGRSGGPYGGGFGRKKN